MKQRYFLTPSGHNLRSLIFIWNRMECLSHPAMQMCQGKKNSFFILSVTNLVFLWSLQQLVWKCGGVRWVRRVNINFNGPVWLSLVSFGWEYSESQMWTSHAFFLKIYVVGSVCISYIMGKSWSPQMWCLVATPNSFVLLPPGSGQGSLNSHLSLSPPSVSLKLPGLLDPSHVWLRLP